MMERYQKIPTSVIVEALAQGVRNPRIQQAPVRSFTAESDHIEPFRTVSAIAAASKRLVELEGDAKSFYGWQMDLERTIVNMKQREEPPEHILAVIRHRVGEALYERDCARRDED